MFGGCFIYYRRDVGQVAISFGFDGEGCGAHMPAFDFLGCWIVRHPSRNLGIHL